MFYFGLTTWRDWFKAGKGMLSSFSDVIGNEDVKKSLGQANGLLAIVVTAIDLIDKVKDEQKSESERAHNRLLKYVLKIIKESLREKDPITDKDRETVLKKIGDSFEKVKTDDKWDLKEWDGFLPDHPVVKDIMEKIKNANEKEFTELVFSINEDLGNKATNDPDYKVFNEWWTRQKHIRELIKHLEKMEDLQSDKFGIPKNKPLSEYYVDTNVFFDISIDTLELKDEQLQVDDGLPVEKFDDAIKHLLKINSNQGDDPPPIVIAGSFGIGKTSALKMISSIYATDYLKANSSSFPYLPIFVSLEKESENEGNEFSDLDNILNEIAPEGNEHAKNRPILLLFDSLEKYKSTTPKIGDKIKQLRRDKGFRNVKVIISMNLNEQLLTDQNIKVNTYTRMLLFNSQQLDEFFKKYNVMEGRNILTHNRALELELPVQEMFRPLFAWIFSYQETSEDSGVKIVQKKKWTPKMKRAWMYYIFFHRMIADRPMEWYTNQSMQKEKRDELYLKEKYLLRAVAALKQIHYDLSHEKSIPLQVVKEEIKSFAIKDFEFDISKIETSYFLSVHYKYFKKWINFVHESFSDYLLAEYYIWTILIDDKVILNKDLRLNIGYPSRETIDFLDGILDLLKKDDKDVEKYISSTYPLVTPLFRSFRFSEDLSVATKQLIKFTSHLIKNEHIIFYSSEDNSDTNQSSGRTWMKVDSDHKNYKLFWIHRWICLFILNKLIDEKGPERDKINEDLKESVPTLIRYSGNLTPGYIKNLRFLDLSGAKLKKANLLGADLSGAKLKKANLFRADLSRANLEKADLSEADLTDVNMSDANLSHAKLPYCVLVRANLSDSNLEGADLSNAKLSYAILPYTNLSNSKLPNTNMSYANFSNANLTNADISEADLSYTNFSDATLTKATIKGCKKFDNLVCYNANFNGVTMDIEDKDRDLLKYMKDHNAVNITKASHNVKDVIPPESKLDVPTSSIIVATFNDTIKKNSINKDSFKLYNGQSSVEGSVSLLSPDYKTAVFIPQDILETNTDYRAEITTEVKNAFDENMKDSKKWKFTTAKTPAVKRLPVLGITASGDDGNVPKNAIDNDLDTRWTDIGEEKWIQIDLGEPRDISRLQIAWFKGNRRIYDYEIAFFDVIEKVDGKETEKRVRKVLPNQKSGEYVLPQITDIAGNVKARYVRIKVKGNNVNNWASITSIDIFGPR